MIGSDQPKRRGPRSSEVNRRNLLKIGTLVSALTSGAALSAFRIDPLLTAEGDAAANTIYETKEHAAATYTTVENVEGLVQNPGIVYVAKGGSDTNSGASWGCAKATIHAAVAAAGKSGTVLVGDGIFSLTSTLFLDVYNCLVGQGSMRTTIAVDFDGVGIDWRPMTVFSGNPAGTVAGFSLVSGSDLFTKCSGIRIASLVKPKLRDVRVANFTGTAGIGVWFQNIMVDGKAFWTERVDVQSSVSSNNTIGVCFDVDGGRNSFMYAESLGLTVNANAVAEGRPAQTGYLLRNGAALLGCKVDFMGNLAGRTDASPIGPTFLRLEGKDTNIVNSLIAIRGEMTSGTEATSIHVAAGAKMLANTGVIAFVNTPGFKPRFDPGSIFGHSGTLAGLGFGEDLPQVDKRYPLSLIREPGATNGLVFNRTNVSAASPLFAMTSHPRALTGLDASDQDLVISSFDGASHVGYMRFRYSAAGPQIHALGAFATRQGGTVQSKILTSGVGSQLPAAGDRHVALPVAFNPTAKAAASFRVDISPDGTTYSTVGTWTRPAATPGNQRETMHIELPHAWYLKVTAENAVIGAASFY